MVDSPYGFLRGTAVVMAEDVAHLPATGITPVVCGDSHLGNFGFYASPEQDLVIDLNDFDEAHPGGWEWDLRRLAASIWVAGRDNGTSEDHCGNAVRSCVASYRHELRRLADLPLFTRSFIRLEVDRLAAETAGPLSEQVVRSAKRARTRTGDRALPRFTHEVDGERRIIEEPPLITRLPVKRSYWRRHSTSYLRDSALVLAACSRRLHVGRRCTQGRRGGQCRPARLRGAAGGFIGIRRCLPTAQASTPIGAWALRAR